MLKKLRKDKGFTQNDLGSLIGKDRSCISKLESESLPYNPSVEIIVKLSKALEVPRIEVFEYFAKRIEKNMRI